MKRIRSLPANLLIAILLTWSCGEESPTAGNTTEAPFALTKKAVSAASASGSCTTIQSGLLQDSAGEVITTGYNQWGHNYQARGFNGLYCDSYRDAAWCQPYKDVKLKMKWNDAWLDNKDCDDDGLLDRHLGHPTYRGSGAWLTNHMSGVDVVDGVTTKWNYFVKIVAAPADATASDGVWYSSDGIEIGPVIWGEFAVIQEVENEQGGPHGLLYGSPSGPGLGKF